MSVPEFLAPILESLKTMAIFSRGKLRVEAPSLKECTHTIRTALKEHLRCEITKEFVVAYDFISTCHYATDDKGDIFTNGYAAGDSYQWANLSAKGNDNFNSDMSSFPSYVVGFRARVYTKITATREASVSVEYESVEDDELGEWGEKLNGFTHSHIKDNKAKELPYTEDTARFFYESMINLCRLAEALKAVLVDPQNILACSSIKALSAKLDES
jgi:hypothetical protein